MAEIARARRAVADLEAKGLLPGQRVGAQSAAEKIRPARSTGPSRHGSTVEVPADAAPRPATPFEPARPAPAVKPSAEAPPAVATPRSRHEQTLEVPPELAVRPAMPFGRSSGR
jgi:hypothetical protein